MKKILSAILAAALLCTVYVPVFAGESDKMQEVLLSVKERIGNTDEFEEFSSSSYNDAGEMSYSFDWSSHADDRYKSLSITASENGLITNYRYYDEDFQSGALKPSIKKMSADEALEKTTELIEKLNPSINGTVRVEKNDSTESLFSDTYSFSLQRYENDIPVYNNSGFVTVNSDATKIIRYSILYNEGIAFEEPDIKISSDAAWKSYLANYGAELEYRKIYTDGEYEIKLVYVPKFNYEQYIDSETGNPMDIWNRYDAVFSANYKQAMTEEAAMDLSGGGSSARLSEVELQNMKEIDGLKSADEAKTALFENEFLDIDKDLILISSNLYREYNGERYFYDFRFEINSENEYRYANATVDAETLEILNWRSRTKDFIEFRQNYEENNSKIIREELNKYAQSAFESLMGRYADATDYRLEKVTGSNNAFSYTRYVNDILFSADYVNMEINPENGKLWSFNFSCTDAEFPSPDGIISEEEAFKKLSEQIDNKLWYFVYSSDNSAKANSAAAGYKADISGQCLSDAFSGELVNWNDSKGKILYSDIDGHYSQKAVEALAKFGIGFDGGAFKPNEIITLNEYITLLTSAFRNYMPVILRTSAEATSEYKSALRDGIVMADDNPNEALTRENAAIYMIKVLGIEEYAKLEGIYKSVFPDVSRNIGYISILGALGVFNGDENGNFNPDKKLTRADAAIIIYNYLAR